MAEPHLHVDGRDVDHADWTIADGEDGFDAEALERAMTESRTQAYAALRDLDAA